MTEIDLNAIKAERARLEAAYITPGRPPTSARGIHHAALICSDVEQTIKFYQGILEFPLTELFGNRDYKGSDRKSTRLNSSHRIASRMPSSA